jgi:hypothetical protein
MSNQDETIVAPIEGKGHMSLCFLSIFNVPVRYAFFFNISVVIIMYIEYRKKKTVQVTWAALKST